MQNPAEKIMSEANRLAYEAWKHGDYGTVSEYELVKVEAWLLAQDWLRLSPQERQEKFETLKEEMGRLGKILERNKKSSTAHSR